MLKTNCKQVKEKVRAFISQNFDASSYGREDLNHADIELKLQFIALTCWAELGHEVKRCNESHQEMFIHWCEGLPSLLDTAYYYCHCSAVDLVGDMLEQTKEERAKYTEIEAERLLSYMIYREVSTYLYKCAY